MDTKGFLKEIRSIIREEIEYALDKRLRESKKPTNETINHGVSLYKQATNSISQKQQVKKQPPKNSNFGSINDILEETRRSLQESFISDDYEGGEMRFNTNSLNAFANDRMGTINATPAGVDPNEVPPEVASALTRDYSALMAKINEKKGR